MAIGNQNNCYPLTLNHCELARPDRIVHLDLAHRAFLPTPVSTIAAVAP
jgi:hypothetical protein